MISNNNEQKAAWHVNSERISARIEALSRIGRTTEGGVTRLAFTEEDRQAVQLVKSWMLEAGLDVRMDAVGNLFGRLPGDVAGPAILSGSHLDSVVNGGKFDGVAGVIAALEAVQTMRERGIRPRFPVEVVAFVNEEGSRFSGGLMGSLALAGKLDVSVLDEWKDPLGVTLREALILFGADPTRFASVSVLPGTYRYFFELHIEQGEVLYRENLPVGIVNGIAGVYQMKVHLIGRSGHAGATPMCIRRDPMIAAARIVLAVKEIAEQTSPHTVGTVGFLQAFPGGHNVIPGRVSLTIDFRDIDPGNLKNIVDQIHSRIADICENDKIEFEIEVTQYKTPVPISAQVIDLMQKCAKKIGMETILLPSGAAHDSMIMAGLCPVGMIFVRSIHGLSHCPEEYSLPEDLALGTELLYRTIVEVSMA